MCLSVNQLCRFCGGYSPLSRRRCSFRHPLSLRASLHRRHSRRLQLPRQPPLVRIAQCRHRRPVPPHHAAPALRCATCCRSHPPHRARTRTSHKLCRCRKCSALLAAAFFALRLRRRRPPRQCLLSCQQIRPPAPGDSPVSIFDGNRNANGRIVRRRRGSGDRKTLG